MIFFFNTDFIFVDVVVNRHLLISDGSGPKKTSPGRARALNVELGPGPGLSPSFKAGLRAGPGGLDGLGI